MEHEHILKHWNEFREAMLCPHVSKVETARLREAFFAGAVAVFQIMAFDIADMSASTADLMRLRPVTFRYLARGEGAPLQYGLIAEEVADVYPEMVTRNKNGEADAVMYQFLAPMLLNQVQRQQRRIEQLEERLEELEKRLVSVK